LSGVDARFDDAGSRSRTTLYPVPPSRRDVWGDRFGADVD
jgi:hypothetical protein